MRVTIKELRSIVKEELNESRTERVKRGSGPGIKLIRVGGLSPVRQKSKEAPERYGVWAFIWPYSEPFLLGSTGPEGITHKPGHTRWDQLQREGWTRFVHNGPLYTILPIPGAKEVDGWYLTDGSSLAAYMSKHYANTVKSMRKSWREQGVENTEVILKKRNPWSLYSKDEFEVFVPEPDEKGF